MSFILATQDEGTGSVSSEQVYPQDDSWVAAIYTWTHGGSPAGGGVVIDERRVLTRAHVVMAGGVPLAAGTIRVAFPKADPPVAVRCRVVSVSLPGDDGFDEDQDVAVLELEAPVPEGVTAARLRCPTPEALAETKWWAFGFPAKQRRGRAADGIIGAALADGWVRIDAESRYPIEQGFSGGGLWSPDFDAVVGLVGVLGKGQAGQSGLALTVYQAAQLLPDQGLRELAEESRATDSGEIALTAWGWTLTTDPEGRRHWRPRARGVAIDSEKGYGFCGRKAALTAIKARLDRPALDRKVLVVTGAPGSGKSAVLGRIVTTADSGAASHLPRNDQAVRATEGSVACAVHAKGLTALDIARQIAKAASAQILDRLEDFPTVLREALAARSSQRFNVIIDALDEAATPAEARLTVTKVIRPLAETCADIGARLVVGSRRTDSTGDLLAAFGGATTLIDLDLPTYFAEEDLAAYAQATLQRAGDERAESPYANDEIAAPVARRIASLSDGNFLVAGLTARTHGLWDTDSVEAADLAFSSDVGAAVREYLARILDAAGVSATLLARGGDPPIPPEGLLLPLAYAKSPGLPVNLWRVAVKALGFGDVDERSLKAFAHSSAVSFLVESTGVDDRDAEFRLFHQALNDALLQARANLVDEHDDQHALTGAFIAAGQDSGWDKAPAYLLRSLPAHAARAGMMDELLADDNYLLYADLIRLQPLADRATSRASQQRARLLRLSPRDAMTASAPSRAAMFSVTEAFEGLGDTYPQPNLSTPYRAVWAATQHGSEHVVLRAHDGWVYAVCAFTDGGATYLATASSDGTARIWDPATGTCLRTLTGHDGAVNAVCAVTLDGTTRLATAGSDGTVRIWDPATGTHLRTFTDFGVRINALCAFTHDGTTRLAAAGDYGIVRIWDPATGAHLRTLTGHNESVNAVCAVTHDGTTLLATASNDRTARIWDPAAGTQLHTLTGHYQSANAVCAFTQDGTTRLATADHDRTVRIWDPATGTELRTLPRHNGWIYAVYAFTHDGTTLLATGGTDGTVRVWDPATGTQLHALPGHCGSANAVCAFTHDGTTLLAIADGSRTVRIWNLVTGAPLTRRYEAVNAVHIHTLGGPALLVTASNDRTVRIWDPTTGTRLRTLNVHHDEVWSVCTFTLDGMTFLAIADYEDLWIWDPISDHRPRLIGGHHGPVSAVCAFALDGTPLLAIASRGRVYIWDPATATTARVVTDLRGFVWSAWAFTLDGVPLLATVSRDSTVRIWDPATATYLRTLTGHSDSVNAVCAHTHDGATFLATASRDRTVRIWDPATGTHLRTLAGHKDSVADVCAFTHEGAALLASASRDATVRIWDPMKEANVLVIPVQDQAGSVAYANGLLFIGTTSGLLAIRLDPQFLSRLRRPGLR